MARVQFKANRAGIRAAALQSREVRAAVHDTAERIADAARARTDDPIDVNDGGQSRARSYVVRLGSGEHGEARDRALGSSVDAGRA